MDVYVTVKEVNFEMGINFSLNLKIRLNLYHQNLISIKLWYYNIKNGI